MKIQNPPILDQIGHRVTDRPERVKYSHLDDEDKLLILWGWSRGWTIKRTAEALPTSVSTVMSYRSKVFENPSLVFELQVLKTTGPKSHQCGLCGENRGTRLRGMRHVLAHILPFEVAKDVPLDQVEKPL